MTAAVRFTRWCRVIIVLIFLIGLGSFFVAKSVQTAPPDAKVEAPGTVAPPPAAPGGGGDQPIILPDDMEVDADVHQFVVVPAKCVGKIKWLIHCDGCDKPVDTFTHPSAPILVVGIPRTGTVLITAITCANGEPFSAQVRVKGKSTSTTTTPPLVTPPAPSQKVDVNLIYNVDSKTPELDAILNSDIAKRLAAEGHAFHAYDYRSEPAVRRKLSEIVTKPGGGGVPSLIILDSAGHLLPEGRALQVPTTADGILALVRKVAG